MMLEALQLLTEEYGQDILFLSIATDPDQNSVKDFIENKDIFIPVLFNNNTDRDYNLYGVPTLFVIDEEGIIHFEHKGYRPDLLQILEVELDYLRESSK